MDPNHTWPKCIGQNIDNREDTTDDTEGQTRNWGEGRFSSTSEITTASLPVPPSPCPAEILPYLQLPPDCLSLDVKYEEKHLAHADV